MGVVLNLATSVVQESQPINRQKCIKIKIQHCIVTSQGLVYKQGDCTECDHTMFKASLGV